MKEKRRSSPSKNVTEVKKDEKVDKREENVGKEMEDPKKGKLIKYPDMFIVLEPGK